MKAFSEDSSNIRRFITERLGIASSTMLAALLVITCLVALAVLSHLSCSSPKTITPPPPRQRPTPTTADSPTPTAKPTPTPTLLPPVTLVDPEDGSCFDCRSNVTLFWESPRLLQADEYYRLMLQRRGQGPHVFFYLKEDHFTLPALSQGVYNWAVAIVRSIAPDKYEPVSTESDWYSFEIAPPTPFVHSISPTSTVQGAGVPVVVSGENLTRSLAIVIGDVTLQTTFVDSSTIAATIPVTLEVGRYPVGIEDLIGEVVWSGFFTVLRPPAPTPGVMHTPIPPAYPPPELGGIDIFGCSLTFYWTWTGELAEDEYFAPRVGLGSPGESRTWTKEIEYSCTLEEAGGYVWEVAICRGDPETHICNLLAVSERGGFWFSGCPR